MVYGSDQFLNVSNNKMTHGLNQVTHFVNSKHQRELKVFDAKTYKQWMPLCFRILTEFYHSNLQSSPISPSFSIKLLFSKNVTIISRNDNTSNINLWLENRRSKCN